MKEVIHYNSKNPKSIDNDDINEDFVYLHISNLKVKGINNNGNNLEFKWNGKREVNSI